MPRDVTLPELAESVVEGEVVRWLVEPGDVVAADAPLVEVMTDKVTVELPSPFSGRLLEQVAAVGDVVAVGAVLARIDDGVAAPAAAGAPAIGGAAAAPAAAGAPAAPAVTDERPAAPEDRGDARSLFRAEAPVSGEPVLQVRRTAAPSSATPATASCPATAVAARPAAPSSAAPTSPRSAARGPFGRVVAVPAARRLARELGVPIETVLGSGPSDRVRVVDVERQARVAPAAGGGLPAPPQYETPAGLEGLETRVPLRGLRRQIARQLVASHLHTVRTLHVDEADVSAVVRLRATLQPRAEASGVRLSYLPFIMRAAVHGLRAFPSLNSSLDEARQEVVLKDYVNLGVAVDTDAGLVVPVVQRADKRSLLELAAETQRLADLARSGSLAREDVVGSSFTISNVGSIGGLFSFPIINAPDAAILGIHRMKQRPVVLPDETIAARPMLYLSLSFDHRLVDGADAVRFLSHVIDLLETPEALLLEV